MTVQLVDESQASGSDMPLMRLTVSQYHVLTGMGFFDSEPGVELLEGYVVKKMAKRPAHTLAKRLLAASLRQQIPVGFFVAEEDPLTLADSEPEPDLTVVRGHPQDFASRNATPAEVLLVVEVADSTLDRDRNGKLESTLKRES